MRLPRLLCAFLLAACCCCRRAAGVPGEAEQPEPELVKVEVGRTALLQCGPSHSQGNLSHVEWFSVHKERQTPIFSVHQGRGQSAPGEYQDRLSLQGQGATLALAHVTPHDERIFLCRGGHPGSPGHRIQLRVYKAPEEPSIQASSLGISVSRNEPEEVATCVGRNGFPVPQVVWYKNGQPLKEQKDRVLIQSSQTVESSGLYTLRSVLKAQLLKEDKDAHFHCELDYQLPSGLYMKESQKVTVPVFYPAERVWLEVEPKGILKEGDRVEIRCVADSTSTPHFSISKQNSSTTDMEEQPTDENGVLVLEPARKEHSGWYECQGLDLETMTSLSDRQELLVHAVPEVRVRPEAPEGREGGSLGLVCEADSEETLEFQWLREKTGEVLERGPELRLHNLNQEAAGGYLCVVSVSRIPGLNSTRLVNVTVSGPPWMALQERRVRVQENTMLNLSCEASGHPRPTISWNVEGKASEEAQGAQSVLSVLSVLATPELLQTGVKCVASNALGRNTTTIVLELDSDRTTGLTAVTVSPHTRTNHTSAEKKLPEPQSKGVVIVAVTVCLLVLAVLGAVLYFFYKKGRLPCGRSGKQEITLPPSRKSEFVVEVKSDKLPEEMGLLQGSTGDKRAPGDQGEKYIDLRH